MTFFFFLKRVKYYFIIFIMGNFKHKQKQIIVKQSPMCSSLCTLQKIAALLKYNSHAIQLNHLMYTIQFF